MKKLLFSLRRQFSSTCSQVREVARLLRLLVKPFRPCEFCHMPQVWLRKPETWKSLNHDVSGPGAGGASGRTPGEVLTVVGRTEATAPVTLRPLPGAAVRSAANAREPGEKTKAIAIRTAEMATAAPRITRAARILVPMS